MRDTYQNFDEGLRLAGAFEVLAKPHGGLGLLTHYESRLQRSFNRAVARLEQIQKEKNDKTNRIGAGLAPAA